MYPSKIKTRTINKAISEVVVRSETQNKDNRI